MIKSNNQPSHLTIWGISFFMRGQKYFCEMEVLAVLFKEVPRAKLANAGSAPVLLVECACVIAARNI